MPLGELYRLTGGWDGVREALGITLCTLSYKDKCAEIRREHAEKQEKMEAERRIFINKQNKQNNQKKENYFKFQINGYSLNFIKVKHYTKQII